ncbi:MAG: S1 RNA-binding domain-containing protein, partial [bacterium]
MSWGQRVKHPSDRFQKGDEVEARVLNIDVDNERFSLGIKQLSEDPWLSVPSRYYLGQVISGKIVHRADFGVFIGIEEGIDGLVHISDMSWGQRVKHPSDRFQKGDEVEARVLN